MFPNVVGVHVRGRLAVLSPVGVDAVHVGGDGKSIRMQIVLRTKWKVLELATKKTHRDWGVNMIGQAID